MATRQAQASDFDRIAVIDDRCVYDAGRRDLIRSAIEAGQCWIVDANRIGVVAFAIVTATSTREPSLHLIVVAAFARRRGIATGLLNEIEQKHPGERIFAGTTPTNTAMRQLLKKRGYAENPYVWWTHSAGPEVLYIKPA
jgi:GNAT superfamily N-acetyltransferase